MYNPLIRNLEHATCVHFGAWNPGAGLDCLEADDPGLPCEGCSELADFAGNYNGIYIAFRGIDLECSEQSPCSLG